MQDDNATVPQYCSFYTEGLLSKWGFGDGDMLDELCWSFEDDHGIDVSGQWLLKEAVKRFVVPQIQETLEVVEIETIHNPIRTQTVNGQKVDWFNRNDEPQPELHPEVVNVPVSDLLALAKELQASRA